MQQPTPTAPMTDLLGLNPDQLRTLCDSLGFATYTAKQLCQWLYAKRATSIDEMTNLSLANRARLKQIAHIGRTAPVAEQTSADGTRKYLFALPNTGDDEPRYIETVFIPDADRATLCVSCQAGCRMGCKFCATGRQGFHGSLTSSQILNQIFSIPEFDRLTNIVFMGMGEPMDNLDAVLSATAVLTAPWGLAWSPKRITVSTVGLVPQMSRFIAESQCHLAVSLHNPVAAEREAIMPVQRAYPIAQVLQTLRKHDWSGQRRLSFEYTLFGGVNDDIAHADLLAEALRGITCRVNLISFHPSPGAPFRPTTPQATAAFRARLALRGITCTLRASRGQDIDAACGLLAGRNRKPTT